MQDQGFQVLLADGPHAGDSISIPIAWARTGMNFYVNPGGALVNPPDASSQATRYELAFLASLDDARLAGKAIAWQVSAKLDPRIATLPVLAWRGWGLTTLASEQNVSSALQLTSGNGTRWPHDGPLVSKCKKFIGVEEHKTGENPPAEGCTCGIYCSKTLSELFGKWASRQAYGVYGLLAGWGKILESTEGYKFERAYPLAMFVVRPSNEWYDFDKEPATSEAIAARLTLNYRRWAFAIAPSQTYEALLLFFKRGWLPSWAMDVLPPDARYYVREYRHAKQLEWGGEER